MSSSNKKKHLRRNCSNIITTAIIIIILWVGFKSEYIEIQSKLDNGDHFNILTINSILAGFLFTSLGILSSALDKPRIERLDKGGYLDDYFNGIYIGIIFNVLSMITPIFITMNILKECKEIFLYIEQTCLIAGVIFFIKSIFGLFVIITRMRNE